MRGEEREGRRVRGLDLVECYYKCVRVCVRARVYVRVYMCYL